MNLTQFRLETDADGIAVVTWDVAGKSMNLIDATMMSELEQVVDSTTADAGVKGVVIASGKDSFSGGADLTMLESSGRVFAETAARAGKDKAVAGTLRRHFKAFAHLPQDRDLRKTLGHRHQRRLPRRRLRTGAGLPLSRHGG